MLDNKQLAFDNWHKVIEVLTLYFKRPGKLDEIKAKIIYATSAQRHYVDHYVLVFVRNKLLIDKFLGGNLRKSPKLKLQLILSLGISEMLSKSEAEDPKIINFAVEYTKKFLSKSESGLVNAVLRKLRAYMDGVNDMSVLYSHPQFLIDRWIEAFGSECTEKLLLWNQTPSKTYFRVRKNHKDLDLKPFKETQWDNFYSWEGQDWDRIEKLLKSGDIYIQDPSTSYAPRLLDAKPGEKVLDLCASPGGKSLIIADNLKQKEDSRGSILVAVDLDSRIKRLRDNLTKVSAVECHVLEHDIKSLSRQIFVDRSMPVEYDAVLLDAPCSNTGVLRRRPDAKWRLTESAIDSVVETQKELLRIAASFVKQCGRLVYSTCSIELQENEGVIKDFLSENEDFSLIESKQLYPWKDECDGAGIFLMRRN